MNNIFIKTAKMLFANNPIITDKCPPVNNSLIKNPLYVEYYYLYINQKHNTDYVELELNI